MRKRFISLTIALLLIAYFGGLFPLILQAFAISDLNGAFSSFKYQDAYTKYYSDSGNLVIQELKAINDEAPHCEETRTDESLSEKCMKFLSVDGESIIQDATPQGSKVDSEGAVESLPSVNNSLPESTSSAVFVENFEGFFPGDNWWVGDLNSNCGSDYWDDTSYRYHGGSWSGWCAQVGDNSVYGGSNSQQHRYDNNMDAYMKKKYAVDMSSWDVGWVDFYAWYDTEYPYDYLVVMWWTGSSWYEDTSYKLSGSGTSWSRYYWRIPDSYLISVGAFGFKFHSDSSIVKEGVYLDDISLWKADITILNYYLNSTSVPAGGTFTAYYYIDNPCPFTLNVGLGLSIRSPDGTTYNDVSHDTVVSVPPFTCAWVSRAFTVPSSAPVGMYDVFWGIWSGFPGQSRWWGGTGWINDVLRVTGLPDLVWTDIWTDPSSPTGGQSARIYWQIKNQGSGDATSTFRNYFYIDGGYIGYGDNNGLAAGSAFNWYVDRILNPGYHIISAKADVNNNIAESNEGNNEYSEKLWWKGPDLIVVDIWWFDAYGNRDPVITSGQPFTVYFQIKNNGDAAASAFTTYLIVDGWGTAAGRLSGLSPGSTYTWYAENVFVSTTGSHWLKVIVDYFNEVAEANKDTGSGTGTGETNNERVEYFSVQTASWTVLVYFDADNNLESYEIDNFNQIAQVGSTQSISIAVQMDRISGSDTDTRYGDWTDCKRFYMKRGVTPDPQNAIQSLGEVNMGDPAVLFNFTIWGVNRYQAAHYLIAINDHGGSWVGCCWDDTSRDHLNISDIRNAFSTIYSRLGRKVDVVWFDACMGCLMSSIEIAYQVNSYVDYMVGSETVGYTSTWDYSSVITYIVNNPTVSPQSLAISIVNLGRPVDNSTYRAQCISAIDLSRVSNLVSTVNSLAQKMQSASLTQLINARRATEWMMGPYDGDTQRIVDLYQLAYNLRTYVSDSDVQSLAQSVMNQIGPSGGAVGYVVMRERHTSSAAFCHGLSIYFPDTKDKYDSLYTYGNRFTSDTQWDEFLSYLYNPSVSVTHSPSNPTDADAVSFTLIASDAYSDLSEVKLKWYNGSWYTKTWSATGDSFSVTYQAGKFSPGVVQYFALVIDQANNIGRDPPSGYKSFTVTDDDAQSPIPSNPSAEPSGSVYDNYTGYIRFKVYWNDQSGISDVKFEFWLDSEQFVRSPTNRDVDAYGNGWYWYEMPKSEWLRALNHQIVWHCVAWDADNDRQNDTMWGDTGIQYGPYVKDDDVTPPSGSNAQPPNGQIYFSDYPSDIRLQVTWIDDTGIANVKFYYKYGDGSWIERTPSGQLGNTYWYDIPRSEWIPHVGQDIQWYSRALDNDSDRLNDQLSADFPSPSYTIHLMSTTPSTTVSVVPSNVTVRVNDSFLVNVTVANVTGLYAWQVKLYFDPSVVNCTGALIPPGHVFTDKAFLQAGPVFGVNYVMMGATLLGNETAFNGSGLLCQLRFLAVAEGNSSLQIDNEDTYLLNRNVEKISCVKVNGYAEVVPYALRFDFGTNTSPVETGFVRVDPSCTYSSLRGYGWEDTVNLYARDRGSPDALRRDFVFSFVNKTFRVDLPNGEYLIKIIVGDQLFAHDNIEIYAEDALKETISCGKGEFVQRSFAVSVSDGHLDLLLCDAGGVDSNWVINALIIEEYTIRKFDFGSDASPVAQGYIRITPTTVYSQSIGYGWVSTYKLQSRDRGLPDDLRRDFVFSSSNGTFRVDVQNGKYVVIVVVGDQYYRHDNIKLFAEGTLIGEITVNAGEFVQKTCVVSVADGSLELSIYDSGGADPNWVINALIVEPYAEIRFDFGTADSPVEPGYMQVLPSTLYSETVGYGWTDTTGLWARDRGLPDTLRRDFVFSPSNRTFRVDIQNGNYMVQVIIGDNTYLHDKIYIYANGALVVSNLTVKAGQFAEVSFYVEVHDGHLDLTFVDDSGADPNWVINSICVKSAVILNFKFDFGTNSSPVEVGYLRVTENTAYSTPIGYGWSTITSLQSRDRGAPDALREDFVFSSVDRTFNLDVPNGKYQVTLIIGDMSFMHDKIAVYAEGSLMVNNFTVPAGNFMEVSFTVTVSDGQLNITFHDDGGADPNWVINCLIVEALI